MIVGRMRSMTFSLCIFFAIDICLARENQRPKVESSTGMGGLSKIRSKNAKMLLSEGDRHFERRKIFGNSALADEEDVSEYFLPTNPEVPEDIPEYRGPSDLGYDQPRIKPIDYEEIDRENEIGQQFPGNAVDLESHVYRNREEERDRSLTGKTDDEAPELDYQAGGDEVDEDQDSEDGKNADDISDEDDEIPQVPRDGLFESPFFNLEQMRRYLEQLERAMRQVFRQTVEEAALLNGTYTNTTEEEVNIDGRKYKVQKSILRAGDDNSSIFIEAVESVAEAETENNRTKRSNWYSADAQTAKASDP